MGRRERMLSLSAALLGQKEHKGRCCWWNDGRRNVFNSQESNNICVHGVGKPEAQAGLQHQGSP